MTTHVPPDSLPRRLFTVVEVEAMVAAGIIVEDERNELIGGELLQMSPKGNRHEVLKTELIRLWGKAQPDDCSFTPETTLRLSEDTYLEPDFVIYARTTKLNSLVANEAFLVVEVADSSLRYDSGRKAAIYARFGVRELWVIDAVRLSIRVFRDPDAAGYREQYDVAADEVATPLVAPPAFALRLADLDLG